MKNNLNLNETQMESFADAAVQHNIEKNLRSKYDKILADKKKNTRHKNSILNINSIIKVAAVLLAVVAGTFIIQDVLLTPSSKSMAQNFLDNTHVSGNPNITRKGSNSANEIQRKANDAFVLKNYSLAIDRYNELKTVKGITKLDQFYLGISYIKTANFSAAISEFKKVKSDTINQIEEVDWFLCLAYVLTDQNELAIPILKNIVAEKRYKSKETKKLLSSIK